MRGQTTLDFTVGVVIFVGVVTAVFLFVPGVVSPFTENTQEHTVAANRVADELAGGLLGSPETPYVLDAGCTQRFFDTLSSPSHEANTAECRFNATTNELTTRVGLKDRQNINVTLEGNVTGPDGDDLLCWSEADRALVEKNNHPDCRTPDDADDGVVELYGGGSAPNARDSTITARRVVSLGDKDVTLIVEVW